MGGDRVGEQEKRIAGWLTKSRYEVVPMKGLAAEAEHLPAGLPVAVTCSPRDGIRRGLEVAESLKRAGHIVVPHLAARLVRDRVHLQDVVGAYRDLGIRELFVVGGDEDRPAGAFAGADELLPVLAELDHGFERIGITAYPEGHPRIPEQKLAVALERKARHAHYMVTQICFEAERIVSWLAEVRRRGVTLPLYVGIPGAVERRRLLDIALRIGVGDSARFLRRHGSLMATISRGDAYTADQLLAGLARACREELGIAGLHINSFNQVATTEAWRQELLQRLAPIAQG
jgi:methylenetetrahydrofolate reductase (NADPH)